MEWKLPISLYQIFVYIVQIYSKHFPPSSRTARLEDARYNSIGYVLLELHPLLTILVTAVVFKRVAGPRPQVPALEEPHGQPANPTRRDHAIASPPEGVAKIVDVARPAPEADFAQLALVVRVPLKADALDL